MPTALATAYVQVVPTTKGLQGALTKELNGGGVEAAGASAGNSFIGKLKGVIVAAGIGKAISSSLMEGSDLQQSLGGVETLFKASADKVIANANAAYKTAGLSANDYMQTVTGFSASLLQSMGGNTSAAADVADMALRDMSDNANKFGTDMASIQYAYQGFAKQNYTMLDNLKLGYGGTKSEMERLLSDATKLTGVKYDISNLSDVYNAIHAIQDNLGVTNTTAEESASTFAGSMASMKAAASNLMAGLALGQDVGPQIDALAETVGTFFKSNFMPMITNLLTGIGKAAPKLIKALVSGITSSLPELITAAVEIVTALATGLAESLPIIIAAIPTILSTLAQALLANIQPLMNAVISIATAIPLWLTEPGNLALLMQAAADLLIALIQGIVTALPMLAEAAWQIITNLVTAINMNLQSIIQAGCDVLTAFWNGITQVFGMIVNTIGQFVITNIVNPIKAKVGEFITAGSELLTNMKDGIESGFAQIFSSIGGWVQSNIIQPVKDKIQDMKNIGKNLVEGLWNGINGAASWLKDKVKSFANGILDKIKSSFGVNSPSKETMWIGQMLTQGLAIGILDESAAVKSAWKAVSSIISPIQSGVSVSTDDGLQSAARGYGGIIINQNIAAIPQTPVEFANATAAYFEQARWAF